MKESHLIGALCTGAFIHFPVPLVMAVAEPEKHIYQPQEERQ